MDAKKKIIRKEEKRSNTTPKQEMPKQEGGITHKGFVKGDPRINRNGRPKSFDTFRELALEIAAENAKAGYLKLGIDENKIPFPILESMEKLSVTEYILRKWAFSNNPILQKAFTEVAYGKVPDEIKMDIRTVVQDLREQEVETELEFILAGNGIKTEDTLNA